MRQPAGLKSTWAQAGLLIPGIQGCSLKTGKSSSFGRSTAGFTTRPFCNFLIPRGKRSVTSRTLQWNNQGHGALPAWQGGSTQPRPCWLVSRQAPRRMIGNPPIGFPSTLIVPTSLRPLTTQKPSEVDETGRGSGMPVREVLPRCKADCAPNRPVACPGCLAR